MAPREDRPYIPWYYKDWLTSPDRFSMTYEQRGVYRDLLDFAWDQFGLPNDKEQIRAMLGLDKRKFALVWSEVSQHFTAWEDGRLHNAKQERVRNDLNTYRERKQDAGRKGGKARAERLAEAKQTGSTATSTDVTNVKPAFASASASAIPSTPPKNGGVRPTPLTMSPLRFAKLQETHAFVGSRLRVPNVLHDECRNGLGGENPEARLQAWYAELDAELERSQEPIPDVFAWLRPKFKTWAMQAGNEASRERLIRELEAEYGR
jgi:uncharacterized protein YdaU (DUF1376 family)